MPNRKLRRAGDGRFPQTIIAALLCALALSRTTPATTAGVAPVRLRWALQPAASATAVPKGRVLGEFSITNTSASPLPGKRWALYFTCTEGVDTRVLQGHLTLERVTGALYRLRPTQGLEELSPGESWRILVMHPNTLVNTAQAPDGPYFVYDDHPEAGLAITDYEMAPFPASKATTPEQIYARNSTIVPVAENLLPPVMPTPREFARRTGTLHWSAMPQVVGQPALRGEIDSAVAILKPYFPAEARVRTSPCGCLDGTAFHRHTRRTSWSRSL